MTEVLRIVRRPRIILLGVLLAIIATAFVSLGFWQLRRLDERRTYNRTLTERSEQPVVDIATLIPDPSDPPEEAAYRRVTATGVYATADEVVIVGRSRNSISGHHVVTPLVLDGVALLVNRGWVELADSDPPVARAAPPPGEVTVTGVLFPSQQRGRFGPKHASDGRLDALHRIDVPRLAQQIDTPLHAFYLFLESQAPAQTGEYPKGIVLPRLEEGPHLSYSLQWFAFAAMAIVTFVAYLVTTVRRERASEHGLGDVRERAG